MKQERFEKQNREIWLEFDEQLTSTSAKALSVEDVKKRARVPWLYRRVCSDYAMAKYRHYSPTLVAQLHDLALRGHQSLYTKRVHWLSWIHNFCAVDFPQTLRRHIGFFWLACALLVGPALALGIMCHERSDLIYSVIDHRNVASYEYMYDPENPKIGREEERAGSTSTKMFGYYISNNIGIGFRIFASGILFGIGTVFFLFYNGIFMGAVAGHLTRLQYGETFWSFVSGHSAFELTAIVISGMAGLMLAHAVFSPGNYRRSHALQRVGREAITLVIGAGLMLTLAAFVEAYWSPTSLVSNQVKYVVGGCLWLLVVSYFSLAGRAAAASRISSEANHGN